MRLEIQLWPNNIFTCFRILKKERKGRQYLWCFYIEMHCIKKKVCDKLSTELLACLWGMLWVESIGNDSKKKAFILLWFSFSSHALSIIENSSIFCFKSFIMNLAGRKHRGYLQKTTVILPAWIRDNIICLEIFAIITN